MMSSSNLWRSSWNVCPLSIGRCCFSSDRLLAVHKEAEESKKASKKALGTVAQEVPLPSLCAPKLVILPSLRRGRSPWT